MRDSLDDLSHIKPKSSVKILKGKRFMIDYIGPNDDDNVTEEPSDDELLEIENSVDDILSVDNLLDIDDDIDFAE